MHSAWCWMIYTIHSCARVHNSDTAPLISWFFWAFEFLLRMIIFTFKLTSSLKRKVLLHNLTKHGKTFTPLNDGIIKSFAWQFLQQRFFFQLAPFLQVSLQIIWKFPSNFTQIFCNYPALICFVSLEHSRYADHESFETFYKNSLSFSS